MFPFQQPSHSEVFQVKHLSTSSSSSAEGNEPKTPDIQRKVAASSKTAIFFPHLFDESNSEANLTRVEKYRKQQKKYQADLAKKKAIIHEPSSSPPSLQEVSFCIGFCMNLEVFKLK